MNEENSNGAGEKLKIGVMNLEASAAAKENVAAAKALRLRKRNRKASEKRRQQSAASMPGHQRKRHGWRKGGSNGENETLS